MFDRFADDRQDHRELIFDAMVDLPHQKTNAPLAFLSRGDVPGDL
jgi:hypothetical protein